MKVLSVVSLLVLLSVSPISAETIVDARPGTTGGVWTVTAGDSSDAYVYMYVGSSGSPFVSNGAQLAIQITGPGSKLPVIDAIDFSGSGLIYDGVPQKGFKPLDVAGDVGGYADCFAGGSNRQVDAERRKMARVHLTTTLDVLPGDYTLTPNYENAASNYWSEVLGTGDVTYVVGTVRVVPEPSVAVQIVGVALLVIPIVLGRRRRAGPR